MGSKYIYVIGDAFYGCRLRTDSEYVASNIMKYHKSVKCVRLKDNERNRELTKHIDDDEYGYYGNDAGDATEVYVFVDEEEAIGTAFYEYMDDLRLCASNMELLTKFLRISEEEANILNMCKQLISSKIPSDDEFEDTVFPDGEFSYINMASLAIRCLRNNNS